MRKEFEWSVSDLLQVGAASSGHFADGPIEVIDAEEYLGIGAGSDILIVDDDETNLTAYEAALAPLGRKLVLLRSGIDALARLLERDFALMLLDVSMPDMGGLETARRVRARARNRGMPILMITGVAHDTEAIIQAYGAGASDYLIKPVLPYVLRAKASVYLELQERTKDLLQYSQRLRDTQSLLTKTDQLLREREAAATTAKRIEKLQEATAALAQARTPADVATAAVGLGAEAMYATAGAMWTLAPDGALQLAGSHGIDDEHMAPWLRIASDSAIPAMRVLVRREPIWVECEADYEREAPETYDAARNWRGGWAFTALPLVVAGKGIGVLSYMYVGDHAFPDDERRFLGALARICEQALDRARLYVAESAARRAAEDENRRKDEYLAMLGHELRNPLASISLAVYRLRAHDDENTREYRIIERQANHLARMVDGLLDLSRVTRGEIRLAREAVQVQGVVEFARDSAQSLIERRGHQIAIEAAPHLLIDADPERARQVFENLITNAAKFTPRPGRIEITAAEDGDFIRMAVSDNGRGIAADLLPTVFDIFVQGETELARQDGGLGVGLTFVRKLVELHGGRVEARSDGVGTGSTFVVWWPRVSSKTLFATTRRGSSSFVDRDLRVLVVDANIDAAAALHRAIEVLGYNVAVAHHELGALVVARQLVPHVALVDLESPHLDGYLLAERLPDEEGCANTLLVALIAQNTREDVQRATRAGFVHILRKPVNFETLAVLLSRTAPDAHNRQRS